MKIETKYDIGQEVWFMENNEYICAKIKQIIMSVFDDGVTLIQYCLEKGKELFFELEDNLFPTKEELLKSL